MPIIIYDGKQLMRASKKEEDMDMDESLHVDSAISIMKLPIEEIVSIVRHGAETVVYRKLRMVNLTQH